MRSGIRATSLPDGTDTDPPRLFRFAKLTPRNRGHAKTRGGPERSVSVVPVVGLTLVNLSSRIQLTRMAATNGTDHVDSLEMSEAAFSRRTRRRKVHTPGVPEPMGRPSTLVIGTMPATELARKASSATKRSFGVRWS